MPRLKGNSSQGSKPTTWLLRTLSWMPHCWPQKQQWVLTSFSGASCCHPPGGTYWRCGPYRSASDSSDCGGLAMAGSLVAKLGGSDTKLGASDRLAFTRRTESLPVSGVGKRVVKAKLGQDGPQIADL